jgi:Cysteine-rich secretory protein family
MLKRLKHLFIPCKGNTYRPDFLERMSVGIMLVLILLSFAMANLQALLWISSDWLVSTILPAVIVDLTNEERNTENLTRLARNEVLDSAAQRKAEDMAKNSYFAHYSPDGVSPWYWFEISGYDYLHAGENLAVHFTESDEVVEAWMNSPTHRSNIMNGQYAEIGVGTARGEYKGRPTIYVVQLFGTPRAPQPSLSEVAGARTADDSSEITIEKVSPSDVPADVAPATIAVRETVPAVPIPQDGEVPLRDRVTETGDSSREVPSAPVPVYTSLATTSRNGEPLMAPLTDARGPGDAISLPLASATAPSLWLEALYAILASIVVGSLITSLMLEWRRHHPIQTVYAGGLLAVMALLLYIHTSLTSQVLIV